MDDVVVIIVNSRHIIDGESIGSRTYSCQFSIISIVRFLARSPLITSAGHRFRCQRSATSVNFHSRCRGQRKLTFGDIHASVHEVNIIAATHLFIRSNAIGIDTLHGTFGDRIVIVACILGVNACIAFVARHGHDQGILIGGGTIEYKTLCGGHILSTGNHTAIGSHGIIAGIMESAIILVAV